MFTLIDVLASREEADFKEISEKPGLHPLHHPPHPQRPDHRPFCRPPRNQAAATDWAMRLLELGNLVKARLSVRDGAHPMRALHKSGIQQPVNLSMRQAMSVYASAPTASGRACRWCAPLAAERLCTLTSTGKLFLALDDPSASAPMPPAPVWQATPATASRNCRCWNENWPRPASTVLLATTKSWSWACAAWPRGVYDDQGNWSQASFGPYGSSG